MHAMHHRDFQTMPRSADLLLKTQFDNHVCYQNGKNDAVLHTSQINMPPAPRAPPSKRIVLILSLNSHGPQTDRC